MSESQFFVCSECGNHNPPGSRFCNQCGAELLPDIPSDATMYNIFSRWAGSFEAFNMIHARPFLSEEDLIEAVRRTPYDADGKVEAYCGAYTSGAFRGTTVKVRSWKRILPEGLGDDEGEQEIELTSLE